MADPFETLMSEAEPSQSFMTPRDRDSYSGLSHDNMSLLPSESIRRYRREAIENYHYAKNDLEAVEYAYEALPKLIRINPFEGKRYFYNASIDRLMGRRHTDIAKLEATLEKIKRIALGDMETIEETYKEQKAWRIRKERASQPARPPQLPQASKAPQPATSPQPSPSAESKTETQPNQPDYNPIELIDYLRRRDFIPVERDLYDAARTLYTYRDRGVDYILGQRRFYEHQDGESWFSTLTKWTVTAFSRWDAKDYFRKFEALSLPQVPKRSYGTASDLGLGQELSRNVSALEDSHFEEIQEAYFVLAGKQDSNTDTAEKWLIGWQTTDTIAEVSFGILMAIHAKGSFKADVIASGAYRFTSSLIQEGVKSRIGQGEYNVDMAELEARTRLDKTDRHYLDPFSDEYAESVAQLEERRMDSSFSLGRALWEGVKSAAISALLGKGLKVLRLGRGLLPRIFGKGAEGAAEGAGKKVGQEVAEGATEEAGEKLGQEITEDAAEEAGKKLGQEATEQAAKTISNRAANRIAGRVARTFTDSEAARLALKVVGENADPAVREAAERAAKASIRSAKQGAYAAAKGAAAKGATEEVVEKTARETMENTVRIAAKEAGDKAARELVEKISKELAQKAVGKLTQTVLKGLFEKSVAAKVITPLLKRTTDGIVAKVTKKIIRKDLSSIIADTADNIVQTSGGKRTMESVTEELTENYIKAARGQAETAIHPIPDFIVKACMDAAGKALEKAQQAAAKVVKETLDAFISQASKESAAELAEKAVAEIVVDAMMSVAKNATLSWIKMMSRAVYTDVSTFVRALAEKRLRETAIDLNIKIHKDAFIGGGESYVFGNLINDVGSWAYDKMQPGIDYGVSTLTERRSVPYDPTVTSNTLDNGIESRYPGNAEMCYEENPETVNETPVEQTDEDEQLENDGD